MKVPVGNISFGYYAVTNGTWLYRDKDELTYGSISSIERVVEQGFDVMCVNVRVGIPLLKFHKDRITRHDVMDTVYGALSLASSLVPDSIGVVYDEYGSNSAPIVIERKQSISNVLDMYGMDVNVTFTGFVAVASSSGKSYRGYKKETSPQGTSGQQTDILTQSGQKIRRLA